MGFRKTGSFPRDAFSFSSKDLSVALGKRDSSSRMAQIPMGFSNMMIQAAKSIPKSTMAQSIPSLTSSSCSTTKHVMVKELLKLFVDKVDGDLFKSIVFKDLKPSNIEHSAEIGLLHGCI